MFGKEKIQALEAKVREWTDKAEHLEKEKADLARQLENARREIADLTRQAAESDVAKAKEQFLASKAEYEGLKELYTKKIQAFEEGREEKEQAFAREAALERHSLENEIRDNRAASQDHVRSTVKSFSESYQYYLSQIKLMMDALGDVAARTGETLFSGEGGGDLKARFGQQLAEKIRADVKALRGADGDLVLIDSNEKPEEPVCEAVCEAAEAVCEEACEEACEAAEAVCEEACEAAEAAGEAVEEAVEEAADTVTEAVEEAGEAAAETAEAVVEEAAEAVEEIPAPEA